MPITPPFPFNRMNKPLYYRMTCSKCGFAKDYELAKNYTVYLNPECDHSDDPEIVKELPPVCPKCGSKLKKTLLPVKIFY